MKHLEEIAARLKAAGPAPEGMETIELLPAGSDDWMIYQYEKTTRQQSEFRQAAHSDIPYLLELVNELKKVVGFYAEPLTWVSNSGKIGCNPIDGDSEVIVGSSGVNRWCGGRAARRFLADLGQDLERGRTP